MRISARLNRFVSNYLHSDKRRTIKPSYTRLWSQNNKKNFYVEMAFQISHNQKLWVYFIFLPFQLTVRFVIALSVNLGIFPKEYASLRTVHFIFHAEIGALMKRIDWSDYRWEFSSSGKVFELDQIIYYYHSCGIVWNAIDVWSWECIAVLEARGVLFDHWFIYQHNIRLLFS